MKLLVISILTRLTAHLSRIMWIHLEPKTTESVFGSPDERRMLEVNKPPSLQS